MDPISSWQAGCRLHTCPSASQQMLSLARRQTGQEQSWINSVNPPPPPLEKQVSAYVLLIVLDINEMNLWHTQILPLEN